VGIVRVSGHGLAALARVLCGRSLAPRQATYLPFCDAQGLPIDRGLALFFPAPHSYTGEDVLELHAHGGAVVLQLLLARCLQAAHGAAAADGGSGAILPGLRLARPGEFTERAFLNGKLDLAQAEGRAHMASKARTLWGALPDGALKQQLLGDIAARVQLPARDLADIWARQSPRQAAAGKHGSSAAASRATPTTPRRPARMYAGAYAAAPRAWPGGLAPAGNAGAARLDQAARLLIVHMALMEELGSEDWDALAHEAGAHGALFRWLEAQFQEAGARPFALLREQLRRTAHEPLVARLMDGPLGQVEGDLPELRRELRDLLNRLLRERIAAQAAAIAARASSDPGAAEQLRQLYARRLALEGQISAAQ